MKCQNVKQISESHNSESRKGRYDPVSLLSFTRSESVRRVLSRRQSVLGFIHRHQELQHVDRNDCLGRGYHRDLILLLKASTSVTAIQKHMKCHSPFLHKMSHWSFVTQSRHHMSRAKGRKELWGWGRWLGGRRRWHKCLYSPRSYILTQSGGMREWLHKHTLSNVLSRISLLWINP